MNSVVIYGSHFGNTQKVAKAIASELESHGPVQLLPAELAPSVLPQGTALVVIGGPTEAFRMTAPVASLLARLDAGSITGIAAAAFDTRVRPRWFLRMFAAPGIAKELGRLGADVVVPAEGFLVEGPINEARGQHPVLVAGELERAAAWAASLAAKVEARAPVNAVA